MKEIRVMMVVIAMVFFSVFLSTRVAQAQVSSAMPTSIDELYNAAKKEGKVVFYSPRDVPHVQKMYSKFKEKFPGIEVEHLDIRQEDIIERIITENKVGKCTIDVGFGGEDVLELLAVRDLMATYNWSQVFDMPKSFVQMGGKGIVQATNLMIIVYNTNLVKNPEKFPKPLKELLESLLEPQWTGKIIAERRAWYFARLSTIYTGDAWMTDYLKKLKGQKLTLAKGTGTVGNMIAAGAGHIGIPHYLYQLNLLKAEKAPIDWIRQSPLGYSRRLLYVTKESPHPNAARLWAGWFCSLEGSQLWEDITTQGNVLPGAKSRARALVEQANIELLTEETPADSAQSNANMEKYSKILMGK